jgi:hypothetical protein
MKMKIKKRKYALLPIQKINKKRKEILKNQNARLRKEI